MMSARPSTTATRNSVRKGRRCAHALGTKIGALFTAAAALTALACIEPSRAQTQTGARVAVAARANVALPHSRIDLEHGLDVAMGRADCTGNGQCLSCYQCHQVDGEGSAGANFPRLAQQSFSYLVRSLEDYASGIRKNETMEPIARALTSAAIRDVAAYYSSQDGNSPYTEVVPPTMSHADATTLAAGGTISALGAADRGVQACVNCHGPAGAGLPPTYPYLAGQYAGYLEKQLRAWESGARRSADYAAATMADIARRLTPEQTHAVAEYFAAQDPTRALRDRDIARSPLTGAPRPSSDDSRVAGLARSTQ
jgi:cytochrome c553